MSYSASADVSVEQASSNELADSRAGTLTSAFASLSVCTAAGEQACLAERRAMIWLANSGPAAVVLTSFPLGHSTLGKSAESIDSVKSFV